MPNQAYLIISPAEPTDTAAAVVTQRQTIPLAWALAVATRGARLISTHGHHYFETRVDDSLKLLDRALASWNYNSYFRDTLAPIRVFRSWLSNFPAENWLYLNISELIQRSPAPDRDLEELRRIPDKVSVALEEIQRKDFTLFIQELRKLSYPFVTVPLTGDRELDIEILTSEMRDMESVEAEMALQMIGVDKDRRLLREATASVRLRKRAIAQGDADVEAPERSAVAMYTHDLDAALELFEQLGCIVLTTQSDRVQLEGNGVEFSVRRF